MSEPNEFRDRSPAEWEDHWLDVALAEAKTRYDELKGGPKSTESEFRRLVVSQIIYDLTAEQESREQLGREVEGVFHGLDFAGDDGDV